MKKQFILSSLGVLTLVGGSWVAAQQRESDRPSYPGASSRAVDRAASESPVDRYDANSPDAPAEGKNSSYRRNSDNALPRASSRARPGQDPRSDFDTRADNFYEELPGFIPAGQSFAEIGSNDPGAITYLPSAFRASWLQRMSPADAARMRAFQDAIRELREAENDAEKTAARDQVTKLVSEQLDADLENREKELAAIEQRAKELRKQLDERKTAKPELLKMLVMLIDNPQVGLGIPPEWMQMLMRSQPPRAQSIFIPERLLPPQPAAPPAATAPSTTSR